jgi:hypothetical protein
MFVPLFALPLAVQLIAAGDGMPKFDVTPSCQGAAKSGYIAMAKDRLKSCMASEMRTRKALQEEWSKFPAADRANCYAAIKGFQPTYSELATCLEMKRALRDIKSPELGIEPAVKGAPRM